MYDKLKQCQSGDAQVRRELLTLYKPFVLKTASTCCKRFIDEHHDDEFSIAYAAFNEAIDLYNNQFKHSFLAFAETMIRNKLIDYFRKEQKHLAQQAPFSSFTTVDETYDQTRERLLAREALDDFARAQYQEARRLELEEFSAMLRTFAITFGELVQLAPKHDDSRRRLLQLARQIADDEQFVNHILHKRKLPISEIVSKLGTNRKTLDTHRKYLLALIILMSYSFPYLRSFLRLDDESTTKPIAEEGTL